MRQTCGNNILPNGTRVMPTEPSGSTDWADPERPGTKWGIKGIGKVIRHSDSHGWIYEVAHESGGTAWSEHGELNLILGPCRVNEISAGCTCRLVGSPSEDKD